MRAVVGHSDEVETLDAIQDALEQCESQLVEDPKAALVFMSVDYDQPTALAKIQEKWPGLPLIGASSDGELSGRGGFAMDSILITLLCGDDFEAKVGLGRNLSENIDRAVEEALAPAMDAAPPAVALTTFAPSTNASEVIRQMNATLSNTACPVLGGLSGDHREFSRMSEFCGSEVHVDSLPVLFLYGNIDVSWGVASGWTPVGRGHQVTKSEGHVVLEIDDAPAMEAYTRYYGEVEEGSLGEYPLAVFPEGADGPWTLRAVLGTNRETGELRFAGEVPEGSWVRLTEVVPEGILSGTDSSVRSAIERFPGDPQVALLFSCAARRWVLGTRAEEELQQLQEVLRTTQKDLALAGLYVFGEIAPADGHEEADFHNETCVTVLLGSRPDGP